MIHELTQAALSFSPDLGAFYAEFEADIPDLNITGHGDGLGFLVTPKDEVVVFEVKSAKASSFKYGKKDGHVQQASIYTIAARNHIVRVTDKGTGETSLIGPLGDRLIGIQLVYVEKESADMKEYFIPYDPVWETELEERVAEADLYRNDPESLPPRLPMVRGKLPWQCNPKWCEWYDRCMKVDPKEVEPKLEGVEHW